MTQDKSWKLEVNSFGNLDQILTEFNGFEIFNTDTTEETCTHLESVMNPLLAVWSTCQQLAPVQL